MPKPRKDLRSEKWVFKAQGCFRNMSNINNTKAMISTVSHVSQNKTVCNMITISKLFSGEIYINDSLNLHLFAILYVIK